MSDYILVDGTTPAFRDRFGNLITVGDWVVVGTRDGNVGGVLLSRVEKIEAKERPLYGWRNVPEDRFTDVMHAYRRNDPSYAPRERFVLVVSVLADVTVRSLERLRKFDDDADRYITLGWKFKRAAKPNVDNMVAYNGKVPDVHE